MTFVRMNLLCVVVTAICVRLSFSVAAKEPFHGDLVPAESIGHLQQLIPELPGDLWIRDWRAVVSSTSSDMPGFRHLIPMEETVEVSGLVLGSNGVPAAGAEVWAAGVFADVPHRERTTTNDRGEFQLRLRPLQGESVRWAIHAFRDDEAAHASDSLTIRSLSDAVPHVAILLQPRGKLCGTVLATETLKPIPDALVYLEDGRILVTDSEGTFTANGLRRSQLDLAVVAPGRLRRYVHFDTSRSPETILQLRMAPGGTIAGRVSDKEGVALNDAIIDMGTSGHTLVMESRMVMSDDDGFFAFDGIPLDSIRYHISASAAGMAESDLEMFTIRSAQPWCFHPFTLRPDHSSPPTNLSVREEAKPPKNPLSIRTLSGTVLGDNDQPVAGASVRNGATLYESRNITCTTDRNGHFTLEGLPTTNCFVTVQAQGYAPVFEEYSAAVSEKTLRLDRGRTVGGIVLTADGKPLSAITVIPVIASPDPRLCNPYWLSQLDAKSNEQGRFQITGLPAMPVRFDFLGEGVSDVRGATLMLNSDENKIIMTADGSIRGRVLNAFGRPIQNFRIRIAFPQQRFPNERFEGFTASFRVNGITYSDAEGWFQLSDLPSGVYYRVTADAVGYGEASIDRALTIPVNEITDEDALELVLGDVCPLHVLVADRDSGRPIQRATVVVNDDPEANPATVNWSFDLLGLPSVLTNIQGSGDFRFPRSGGVICVSKPGYARASVGWIAGDQKAEVVLDPESRINGSVRTSDGQPVPGCWFRLTDVIGSQISAETASDGDATFEIGELAAGIYELTVGFENRELTHVKVSLQQGQTLELPVEIEPKSDHVSN